MNNWADRFLFLFCGFLLLAILIVPFGENAASPLAMMIANWR